MRTLALLALAILFAPHSAPAATVWKEGARKIFGDCTPAAEGAYARRYDCPGGISASIVHSDGEGLNADAMLEGLRKAIYAVARVEGAHEKPATFRLRGADVQGLRMEPRGKKPPLAFADIVVVKLQGGALRPLLCAATSNDAIRNARCKEMLAWLAQNGVPEIGVDIETTRKQAVRFLGKELAAPEGCEVANATPEVGRIQCSDGFLAWNVVSPRPETEGWIQTFLGMIGKIAPDSPVRRTDISCEVQGRKSTCMRADIDTPRGPLVSFMGITEDGAAGALAWCAALDARAPTHPVCNGLIRLLPTVK